MDTTYMSSLLEAQRRFFSSGKTLDVEFRLRQLKALQGAWARREKEIFEALHQDLRKPAMEAYTAEYAFIKLDIEHTIKNLKRWMKPLKVGTPPVLFPSTSSYQADPRGVVLVIGAWNYPFQLVFSPLIAAIAGGNCVVVKPSEVSEASARLAADILRETFGPEYVAVVEGGVSETTALLEQKFDHIFFTGSTTVGRIIYQAAARQLTPVTLELGGKSPCIVDATARMEVACRRIAFGKWMNAGQTCVAPDYVLVQRSVRDAFVQTMKKVLQEFYGSDPKQSPDLARIINARHHQRLVSMLADGEILLGGEHDAESRYIAPTLLTNVSADSRLMSDEIFGPLLPVVEYETVEEAIQYIRQRPHPLALYVFSEEGAFQEKVLKETTSGGACVNECIVHLAVPELPFGGVGESGIGAYHGRHGFDTFTHQKAVLRNPTFLDVKLKYPPYRNNLSIIRKMM